LQAPDFLISTLEPAYEVKNCFQAFAFKWVNLYRYAEDELVGVKKSIAKRMEGAPHEVGGCTSCEFSLPTA
jgi:hypothetical protein